VVSFSDFMCPFCRDLANGLKNFLPTTGNQIQTRYKYFPLDKTCNARLGQTLHPGACELALGGVCAEESGRFWEYHDKVFSERWDRATREDVLRIGASVGLDGKKLSACMDAAASKGLLAKDIDEGYRVGVGSTPTIFINGRKLSSTSVFLLAIEEERKRLNLPLVAPRAPQEK
jgi:protein-disulfide isomerase